MDEQMFSLIEQLSAKFDRVYERTGRGRDEHNRPIVWRYIATSDIIERLNQVFGIRWNAVEVYSEVTDDGYVVKRVQLEVQDPDNSGRTYIKEGIAAHKFMTGDPADAHKSAFSKAITKAASLLGIGLYLYRGEEIEAEEYYSEEQDYEQEQEAPPVQARPRTPTKPPAPSYGKPLAGDGATSVVAGVPLKTSAQPKAAYGQPLVAKGFTSGQGTSATVDAQLSVGDTEQTEAPSTKFQLDTIRAGAQRLKAESPLTLVYDILGDEAAGIESLEQLTLVQAGRIMGVIKDQSNMGKL